MPFRQDHNHEPKKILPHHNYERHFELLLLAFVTPLKNAGLEGSFVEEQVEAHTMGCARLGDSSAMAEGYSKLGRHRL